jgi:DNA-binding XRE family transcriptional regulator
MSDAVVLSRRVIPDEPPPINQPLYLAACLAKGAITEEDRAHLLGMPRRSVYRYEKNKIVPLLTTARWIASRLDVTIDELWPAA